MANLQTKRSLHTAHLQINNLLNMAHLLTNLPTVAHLRIHSLLTAQLLANSHMAAHLQINMAESNNNQVMAQGILLHSLNNTPLLPATIKVVLAAMERLQTLSLDIMRICPVDYMAIMEGQAHQVYQWEVIRTTANKHNNLQDHHRANMVLLQEAMVDNRDGGNDDMTMP
jgi:hypothetical protein